jgi:hypothetical protein
MKPLLPGRSASLREYHRASFQARQAVEEFLHEYLADFTAGKRLLHCITAGLSSGAPVGVELVGGMRCRRPFSLPGGQCTPSALVTVN